MQALPEKMDLKLKSCLGENSTILKRQVKFHKQEVFTGDFGIR